MTHLAMQEVDDEGSPVSWGKLVTDEEYGSIERPAASTARPSAAELPLGHGRRQQIRGTTDAGREYRRARAPGAVAVAVAITLVVISAPAGARPTARAATVRPNILSAVDGTSPSNAWAVGTTTVGSASRALIEHWNGTSWQIQKSANVGTGDSFLTGVEAISPTNAWAVGTSPSPATRRD